MGALPVTPQPPSAGHPLTRPDHRPRWQIVRERISADLVGQVYPPGAPLPPAKTLCEIYGTSHANLRRALRCLADDRRLAPHKRTYRVSGPRPPRSRAAIAMVATMDLRELLTHLGPRAPALWRSLEDGCRRLGLTLDIYDYRKSVATFPWPDGKTERLVDRIDTGSLLGFLVWSFAMNAQSLASIMTMLAQTRKPVSVLCETWDSTVEEYEQAVARAAAARLFTVAMSGSCGERMGEYLLALGHRQVAVFCPEKATDPWLRRYRGIMSAYERAGLPASAVALFEPSPPLSARARQESRLLEQYERTSERLFARIKDGLTDSFLANGLNPFLYMRRLQYQLAPVFAKVLAERHHTAWVGLSDSCARTALYFLRDQGARVPEEISVVGFDNDSESFADGLTTYDFNMAGVVQAMLEHVVTYRRGPGAPPGPRSMEIPGTVLSRQSAGPARR